MSRTSLLVVTAFLALLLSGRAQAQLPMPPTLAQAQQLAAVPVTQKLLLTALGELKRMPEQAAKLREQRVEALLQLVETAPYVYQPTAEEEKELREAGAKDELLAALKAAARDVGKPDESGLAPFDRQLVKQLTDKNVMVRARAAQTLGRRKAKGAAPALAALLASDFWETGASLPITGSEDELEFYLYTDASKVLALDFLLTFDRPAALRALLKGMDSPEPKARAWATAMLTQLISERPDGESLK